MNVITPQVIGEIEAVVDYVAAEASIKGCVFERGCCELKDERSAPRSANLGRPARRLRSIPSADIAPDHRRNGLSSGAEASLDELTNPVKLKSLVAEPIIV